MKKKSKKNLNDFHHLATSFNTWLHELSKLRSANTIAAYRTTLKLFVLDFLHKEKGLSFKSFDCKTAFSKPFIKEWLDWLSKERSNSPQTQNLRLSNLCAFLQYMSDNDVEYVDYFLNAKSIEPRRVKPPKVHSMSEAALEAIINAPNIKTKVGVRDTVMMGLIFVTGARINEVLSLRIRDVKLPKKKGTEGSVTFLGKGNKYRTIPILEATIEQLRLYIRRFHGNNPNNDDLLFFTQIHGVKSKITQRAINYRLKKYASEAAERCDEVPTSLHSHLFRHSRATLWVKEGHNLAAVSRLLGHESITTTMHYLDITPQMIADEVQSAMNIEPIEAEWEDDENIEKFFNF